MELAKRMGFHENFTWNDERDWMNFRLKPLGISVEELKQLPGGYIYSELIEKKYQKDGFNTPSGKVEIFSEELKKNGYDPLPVYVEPAESPESTPEIADAYPLVLTTGARIPGYLHSRFRNIPSLRKLVPDPIIEINENKALELGLREGEAVVVESLRGSIELKVKSTKDIFPEMVQILHGWEGANVNLLTDDEILDPISGFPSDRSFLARVKKRH